MAIKAIFAVDDNGGMGFDGSLPWPSIPEDFKWFKKHTSGQVVVMGRKTWNDPKMPKPLPGRTNIIFTNNDIDLPNVYCVNGDYISNILTIQEIYSDKDVFIIGGPNLLKETKSITEKVYLTKVHGSHKIDVSINLPEYLSDFQMVVWEQGEKCDFSIFQNRGYKSK